MQFNIKNIEKNTADIIQFREDWIIATITENLNLEKVENSPSRDGSLSSAQELMINLFTSNDTPYYEPDILPTADETIFSTNMSAQGELEALFRGRARALVMWINRVNKE